jgi:lipoprotein LpqH
MPIDSWHNPRPGGFAVKNELVVVAAAALIIGGSVACSSGKPAKLKPGELLSGTAQVTIDGASVPAATSVSCAPPEQYLTTMTAGDDNTANATVLVSNANKLTVELVRIRNLNGFSGDYARGLQGEASVALTESTYHITGTAYGFSTTSPEPTTQSFTIAASC